MSDQKLTYHKNSDSSLKESPFGITPAPEYCDSDTLLASLYRVIGFKDIKENNVVTHGILFSEKLSKLAKSYKSESDFANTVLKNPKYMMDILHKVLSCPKSKKASKKQQKTFVDTPLTPSIAIFSGTNNFGTRTPWTPGNLIKRMIMLGCRDKVEAETLWKLLFDALTVSNQTIDSNKSYKDDIYAIFLEKEIKNWLNICGFNIDFVFQSIDYDISFGLTSSEYSSFSFPAKQFTIDIRNIIKLKDQLCRKEWISLLDSILRLASVSHVLWLCNIQSFLHDCICKCFEGNSVEIDNRVLFSQTFNYARYGEKANSNIKDLIGKTIYLNEEINFAKKILGDESVQFKTANDFNVFFSRISENHIKFKENRSDLDELISNKSKEIRCISGTGANKFEFVRYILGKRSTLEQHLQGYDQGFFIKKKGLYTNSPMIFSMGDTALLAVSFCSIASYGDLSSKSVGILQHYMEKYGIKISDNSIQKKELSKQLRLLGLLLDSPDSDSGMQILPPFEFE